MRARSREINIFNMSLLDILCGALGAFCFMMLVLLPYYKPPAKSQELQKEQQDTNDLVKQIEKLKDQVKDSALAEELQQKIQELQDQLKQMQGQMNQLSDQNQQLTTERDQLTAKNQDQENTIASRQPIMTLAMADPREEVALYLLGEGSAKKAAPAPFNPAKPHGPVFWAGDNTIWNSGLGWASWVVRDSPPGYHYKVYVSLAANPKERVAAAVTTTVIAENSVSDVNPVQLTPARFWALLGTMTIQSDGKEVFAEATAAQRDAEWTRIEKSPPPPVAPPVPGSKPPGSS